ncbi:MAG: hypothetical protein ACTTJ7_02125 [Treponema sp.]
MKNNFDSQDNNSLPLTNMHDTGKLDQYGVFVKKKHDIKKLPNDDQLSHLGADFTQSSKIPSFEDAAMSKKDDDFFDFDIDSKDDFQQEGVIPPLSADSEKFDFELDDLFDEPFEDKDSLAFLESEDDSFSLHDDKVRDSDDYLADAFEDIALKDLDDLNTLDDLKTDEALDAELFTVPELSNEKNLFDDSSRTFDDIDTLEPLPELMPPEDEPHNETFFNDLEAVKSDLLAEPNTASFAQEQPDHTASATPATMQPQGPDKSTELLLKIAQEIDTLKTELTSIKAELADHASRLLPEDHTHEQPDSKATAATPSSKPASASNSGFFSDDDTDNTIALTGDELNNLVVASVQAQTADPDHGEALDDSSFNLDTKYVNQAEESVDVGDEYFDEDDALPNLTAHWTSAPLAEASAKAARDTEEKLSTDIPAEQEITVPSFTEELMAEPIEVPVEKETLAARNEPVSNAETDTPVLQVEDDAALPDEEARSLAEPISDAEADIPVLQIEDVQDDEILLYEEDKRLLERSVNDAATDIPVLPAEDDIQDGACLLPEEDTKRLDEPVSDAEADIPVLQVEDVQDDEVPLYEEDKRLLEQSISGSNAGAPLVQTKETSRESNTGSPFIDEKTTGTVAMPVELKNEIKSVLAYMDRLLEALPESKIEEFAKSEYFEVYKHLFDELGIAK